jgi:hypothetical protein
MIKDKFNDGFIVSKDKHAPGAASDVHFEPLSKGQYKTTTSRMTLCAENGRRSCMPFAILYVNLTALFNLKCIKRPIIVERSEG